MEKQLIFLDVDGTLLFRNADVCKSDVQALLRLQAEGHEIFINSGRSRSLIPRELTEQICFDGFICGSTYVEYRGEVLHRASVEEETIRKICRHALKNGWRVLLEGETAAYGIHGGVFHPNTDITDAPEAYLQTPADMRITKFTFDRDIPDEIAAQFSGVRIINFGGYSEGIVCGYDKAFGMRLLCEKLSVSRENTVAFGDSVNDIEMLAYAGKGVVMHSAPAALDRYATLRADVDFGGVAFGIEKIFFGESK